MYIICLKYKSTKYEILIDTYEKTPTSIMVISDEMMKKEKYTKKTFINGPNKLDSIIDAFDRKKVRESHIGISTSRLDRIIEIQKILKLNKCNFKYDYTRCGFFLKNQFLFSFVNGLY